jgi:putative tricarboxylic transport membrane protein
LGPLGDLLAGFAVALTPQNLFWALVGVVLGTAVGVLPGIGPALTVALLLPLTYRLDATGAFIMFAGIYYGGMYGGSTTSILLNTPGESSSIATALEGNLMAKRGRGSAALATAAVGSFVAGTIGTVGLTFLAPVMVDVGLRFGPAEYFALTVLAFTTITALLGASLSRGSSACWLASRSAWSGSTPSPARAASPSASPSCRTGSTSSPSRSASSPSARRSGWPPGCATAPIP